MASTKKTPKKKQVTDLSPEALRAAINDRFGEGTMLMASDPSFEVQRLSTGILALDWFLNGGFARGRHTEIYGSPNVGKTYTALKFIATSQAAGLRCAFVNVERSFDKEFARRIGVDLKRLELIKHRNANQAIDIAELILRCEEYDVIVLDSIAALTPLAELESEMSDTSYDMGQAKLMSKALRKLTTAMDHKTAFVWINQVRENVGGVQWGKKTRTSGGMAMSFYASTRIEMVKTETIKSPSKMITPSSGKSAAKDLPRGHRVLARIEKEKAGARPYAETTFVFDNRKVRHDPIEDLMYVGRQMDLVKLKGDTWWVAGKRNPQKCHGRPKFRAYLANNPKTCTRLEKKIRERIGKDIFEDA